MPPLLTPVGPILKDRDMLARGFKTGLFEYPHDDGSH